MTTVLTDDSITPTEILNESIDFAVEFIKSKIQHRYDPDQIFIDVNTFDLSTAYAIGDLVIYSEDVYSLTTTYSLDDRVSYNNKIYAALQETTGDLPTDDTNWELVCNDHLLFTTTAASTGNYPDDTDYFSVGDNRNSLIKNYAIYLAIDNMFPHINPRVVPDWIVEKSKMAQEHLNRIASGKDTVILPLYTSPDGDDDESRTRFAYGSDTIRTIDY